MSTPHDEYDVAFSFVASDLLLAEQLADAVRDRLRPFVFSEAQKEIAGKDGATVFGKLFGETASLVVVLYRSGYGSTQWTRLEEAAITSRGVEYGWNSVLVISLDATKPPWIPGSRLWLGLDAFGFDAAVDVVLARHEDTKRSAKPETALEHAKRASDARVREQEASHIARSEKGVALAQAGVEELWRYLGDQAAQVNAQAGSLGARLSEPSRDVRYFESDGGRISFGWSSQYSSSLDEANLLIRTLEWPRERSYNDNPDWRVLGEDLWLPCVHPDTQRLAWRLHKGATALLTTTELAERYLLKLFKRPHRGRT